jgi:hypothetical protein
MAKITLPPVIRSVSLAEYETAYDGVVIGVWVTAPRAHYVTYTEIQSKLRKAVESGDAQQGVGFVEQLDVWWSKILHDVETGKPWTVDDVRELRINATDNDPDLWRWITAKAFDTIGQYRLDHKKKLNVLYTQSAEQD